ncbi:efflux RND transporter permease subunit [Kordiimonas sp.]|uniref:efflux RND transporter permease subunit n=1 Tax=Kordiimonas sp. TaxID=1970157 RepID=UPI003B527551
MALSAQGGGKSNAAYKIIAPLFLALITAFFFFKVDLEPKITPDFFFSSDSEIFQKNQKIVDEFPSQQQILLNVTTAGSFEDPNFIEKIDTLTKRIQQVEGVTDVQSITNGPDDLEAARENPLWRRLLIGNDDKSSFIIAFIDTDSFTELVESIETIVGQEENKWFAIRISGLPYIVEQIRRNLTSDMKTFSLGAMLLSALVLFVVFRSPRVVIGAIATCIAAAMLTLAVQSLFGIPIGILTANLGAIVFVLTLSHVIFLTSNRQNDMGDDGNAPLMKTVAHTFPASTWAALTTFLGFASLIFVDAKPLNQLGVGGTVGTVCALVCAYGVYPYFLARARIASSSMSNTAGGLSLALHKRARVFTLGMLVLAIGLTAVGLPKLNTDPSLLSYFKEESELHNGIYHVDENGGSNPLLLVVRRENLEKLDNSESYKKMWDLQQALSEHEAVGSVISLPVIMAEGDEHWLGQLLPWNLLLDILSNPDYGAVAKSFVTEDRTHALFMLRMRESGRERDRLEIINEVEKIPGSHGFEITLTGGTYYLQGELAASVARSMTTGVVTLILMFGVIAYIVSGTLMVSFAVMLCAAIISAIILGGLGALGMPVDIISSPAINICLGLIVDDMIHITVTAKRTLKEKGLSFRDWAVWKAALETQSWPALISTLAIMIGFSVFALSDFPPSQRFGVEIAIGAGIAVLLALIVFPYIASRGGKKA